MNSSLYLSFTVTTAQGPGVIAESEREGTRAETRIGLSVKRTSPFKSAGGVSSIDYWQFRCSDEGCKTTGYPLHSHFSPSLPVLCVTVCRLIPIQLYHPYIYHSF